mmetsp:Transcript_1597/g.2816  ORF Transcript_1597/g.2816 Transcript_1597/m.2816 type:complete len:178 (-) Transcript_1597:675-1208(-)
MIDTERPEGPINLQQIGRIEDEQIFLRSDEIALLTKKYVTFYKNRQAKISQYKKTVHEQHSIQKKKLGEQPKFRPEISDKNKKLAEQQLMKDPVKASMKIEDRLIKEKYDIYHRRETLRQLKIEEELSQPYKPYVSESSQQLAFKKSVTHRKEEFANGQELSKWDKLHLDAQRKKDK